MQTCIFSLSIILRYNQARFPFIKVLILVATSPYCLIRDYDRGRPQRVCFDFDVNLIFGI